MNSGSRERAEKERTMKVGELVADSWWRWRIGRIVAMTKTRIKVRWDDGKIWSYDKLHQRFLERAR